MASLPQVSVSGISALQWARLRSVVDGQHLRILEATQLSSAAGISPDAAIRLLFALAEIHVAVLQWSIFHHDHSAAVRLFSAGAQPLPWRCPECEEVITDASDLEYTLRGELHHPSAVRTK